MNFFAILCFFSSFEYALSMSLLNITIACAGEKLLAKHLTNATLYAYGRILLVSLARH